MKDKGIKLFSVLFAFMFCTGALPAIFNLDNGYVSANAAIPTANGITDDTEKAESNVIVYLELAGVSATIDGEVFTKSVFLWNTYKDLKIKLTPNITIPSGFSMPSSKKDVQIYRTVGLYGTDESQILANSTIYDFDNDTSTITLRSAKDHYYTGDDLRIVTGLGANVTCIGPDRGSLPATGKVLYNTDSPIMLSVKDGFTAIGSGLNVKIGNTQNVPFRYNDENRIIIPAKYATGPATITISESKPGVFFSDTAEIQGMMFGTTYLEVNEESAKAIVDSVTGDTLSFSVKASELKIFGGYLLAWEVEKKTEIQYVEFYFGNNVYTKISAKSFIEGCENSYPTFGLTLFPLALDPDVANVVQQYGFNIENSYFFAIYHGIDIIEMTLKVWDNTIIEKLYTLDETESDIDNALIDSSHLYDETSGCILFHLQEYNEEYVSIFIFESSTEAQHDLYTITNDNAETVVFPTNVPAGVSGCTMLTQISESMYGAYQLKINSIEMGGVELIEGDDYIFANGSGTIHIFKQISSDIVIDSEAALKKFPVIVNRGVSTDVKVVTYGEWGAEITLSHEDGPVKLISVSMNRNGVNYQYDENSGILRIDREIDGLIFIDATPYAIYDWHIERSSHSYSNNPSYLSEGDVNVSLWLDPPGCTSRIDSIQMGGNILNTDQYEFVDGVLKILVPITGDVIIRLDAVPNTHHIFVLGDATSSVTEFLYTDREIEFVLNGSATNVVYILSIGGSNTVGDKEYWIHSKINIDYYAYDPDTGMWTIPGARNNDLFIKTTDLPVYSITADENCYHNGFGYQYYSEGSMSGWGYLSSNDGKLRIESITMGGMLLGPEDYSMLESSYGTDVKINVPITGNVFIQTHLTDVGPVDVYINGELQDQGPLYGSHDFAIQVKEDDDPISIRGITVNGWQLGRRDYSYNPNTGEVIIKTSVRGTIDISTIKVPSIPVTTGNDDVSYEFTSSVDDQDFVIKLEHPENEVIVNSVIYHYDDANQETLSESDWYFDGNILTIYGEDPLDTGRLYFMESNMRGGTPESIEITTGLGDMKRYDVTSTNSDVLCGVTKVQHGDIEVDIILTTDKGTISSVTVIMNDVRLNATEYSLDSSGKLTIFKAIDGEIEISPKITPHRYSINVDNDVSINKDSVALSNNTSTTFILSKPGYTISVTDVKMGGTSLTPTEYSYANGVLIISVKITGNMTISTDVSTFTVSVNGVSDVSSNVSNIRPDSSDVPIKLSKPGYPLSVTSVTMGDDMLTADTDYVWSSDTGTLRMNVPVTGNIVITVSELQTRTVTVSGVLGVYCGSDSVTLGNSGTEIPISKIGSTLSVTAVKMNGLPLTSDEYSWSPDSGILKIFGPISGDIMITAAEPLYSVSVSGATGVICDINNISPDALDVHISLSKTGSTLSVISVMMNDILLTQGDYTWSSGNGILKIKGPITGNVIVNVSEEQQTPIFYEVSIEGITDVISDISSIASGSTDVEISLSKTGYTLSVTSITMNGELLVDNTDYTWVNGTLKINGPVSGDVVIIMSEALIEENIDDDDNDNDGLDTTTLMIIAAVVVISIIAVAYFVIRK